eukprot:6072-Amphidinium_carterae.1
MQHVAPPRVQMFAASKRVTPMAIQLMRAPGNGNSVIRSCVRFEDLTLQHVLIVDWQSNTMSQQDTQHIVG